MEIGNQKKPYYNLEWAADDDVRRLENDAKGWMRFAFPPYGSFCQPAIQFQIRYTTTTKIKDQPRLKKNATMPIHAGASSAWGASSPDMIASSNAQPNNNPNTILRMIPRECMVRRFATQFQIRYNTPKRSKEFPKPKKNALNDVLGFPSSDFTP